MQYTAHHLSPLPGLRAGYMQHATYLAEEVDGEKYS